jgi:plastocyanin
MGTKSIEPKINQAVLPSPSMTNTSKTSAVPDATAKPLTELKPPVNDAPSQSDGSTVSIVSGSSVPSNGKYFVPEATTVAKGDTVTWTNEDTVLHTVTSGTPDEGNSGTEFDSSYLAAGKTFEHQFNTAGTFDYYCTLHPYMTGKVKVQ